MNRTDFVTTQSHGGSPVVAGLNGGVVRGGRRKKKKKKKEESNRPRFPQVGSQIFRFHPENRVDIDEATV